MYIFYLDESGNTGLDLSLTIEAVHWLVVLGATEHDVRNIETDIRAIADSYFGQRARTPGFEFHGAEIFGGRGVARTLAPARQVDLFADVLGLLDTHRVHLWVRGIHKARLRDQSDARREDPEHPSILAFRHVVAALDIWLRVHQPAPEAPRTGAPDRLGLLVSDQQDEVSCALAAEFARPRNTGIRSLIDTIHYVRSRDSRLIVRNRFEKNLTRRGGDTAFLASSTAASGRARKEGRDRGELSLAGAHNGTHSRPRDFNLPLPLCRVNGRTPSTSARSWPAHEHSARPRNPITEITRHRRETLRARRSAALARRARDTGAPARSPAPCERSEPSDGQAPPPPRRSARRSADG